ncbi:MAG: DUF3800 domain-containing protein [Verrucomicrobia bacterium]|jgi:hypothetical protein|nr:DUF3800 domain-containing protein [Verrucomicrobiota bacterium]
MDEDELPLFKHSAKERSAAGRAQPQARGERPFGKYIVYVDESGDHGMASIDQNYPIFVLAFCIFHKGHYSDRVVPALERFKFRHFGHDQVVLHEHEIRKEKGAFRIFPNRAAKTRFLEGLTGIVEASNFILASCVIEKGRLRDVAETPDNPYHIALMHCVLSLHDFLVEKGEQEHLTHVVVEQRGAKEDKELELEFRRICDGSNPRALQLPFEILFADKKAMSSGLQLADLVARPVGLHVLRPDQPNRAFDALKAKFFCKGGRANLGEAFDGWGLKIMPPRKSEGLR